MAGLRASVKGVLADDATLSAIITGGVFDAEDFDWRGLTSSESGVYTNNVLNPLALVRWRTTIGTEIVKASERKFFSIYFYDDAVHGLGSIDDAMRRCKVLLHRQQMTVTDRRGVCMVHWVDDVDERETDDEDIFGGAFVASSRYYVDYVDQDRLS